MSSPSKPRGRPPTITPEVRARICDTVKAGNFRYVAALAAGVPVRTMRSWLQRGREQETGPYRDFLHALLEAEKAAEIHSVALIMKAAEEDAAHARWWLERRYPHRWGNCRSELRELRNQLAKLEAMMSSLPGRTQRDPTPETARSLTGSSGDSGQVGHLAAPCKTQLAGVHKS